MTDSISLELERFEELLDVHGADLARWPEELQAPARELLASSSAAQLLLARAQRLSAVLDAAPDLLPSAELSARIAALPVRHRQGWAAWWPFGNPLAPLLVWGAAAAFGLFVGSGGVPGVELWSDPGSDPGFDPAIDPPVASSAAELARAGTQEERASALAREQSGTDEASGDELDSDEQSDLDLAFGLGSEWEEQP